jgi:hypothetical protein
MTDWTPQEQNLLSHLPREASPPPHLEHRIATALFARRRIKPWVQLAAAAAIAIIGFGAGFGTGRSAIPVESASPRFLLLLRKGAEDERSPKQVPDYVAWARAASEAGILVGGEKLSDEGWIIAPPALVQPTTHLDAGEIGGYFMITAPDLQKATEVALETPHLRYGGTIELRPVQELP